MGGTRGMTARPYLAGLGKLIPKKKSSHPKNARRHTTTQSSIVLVAVTEIHCVRTYAKY